MPWAMPPARGKAIGPAGFGSSLKGTLQKSMVRHQIASEIEATIRFGLRKSIRPVFGILFLATMGSAPTLPL